MLQKEVFWKHSFGLCRVKGHGNGRSPKDICVGGDGADGWENIPFAKLNYLTYPNEFFMASPTR